MKQRLEAKPTILQLIRTWFSTGVFLMAALLLVAVPAEPVFAAERYVYAKVFIDGIGTEHGYGYMRDVYLDVAAIPSDAVVHQDSGILFTDQNYKKTLSPIQISALEFVKPHLKDLGFKKVSDYQVFIYPADKKDPIHSKMDAVQKKRNESLAIPSKLTGEKAELHGDWTQVQAAAEAKPPAEAKSTSTEVKTPAPDAKPASSKTVEAPVKPVETANKASVSAEQQKLKLEEDAADAKAKAKARAKKKKEKEEARKKALAAAKTQDDIAQPNENNEEVNDNRDEERETREERRRKRELERELKAEMAMEKQKEMTMEREKEAEKKARARAKGKVVKEMVYSDDLKEQQAKSWCKRVVPEFLKSVAAENNTLINVGGCSCKPQGEPGSLVFKCQFPATYRRASAADTLTQ